MFPDFGVIKTMGAREKLNGQCVDFPVITEMKVTSEFSVFYLISTSIYYQLSLILYLQYISCLSPLCITRAMTCIGPHNFYPDIFKMITKQFLNLCSFLLICCQIKILFPRPTYKPYLLKWSFPNSLLS